MKFVSRDSWGARPPARVDPLPAARVDTVYVHYSAADADEQADHANCPGRVRGIQRFHMDTRGWNDIAYSFLTCKHGYVFAGRGFGVHPAATGSDNSHSLAVCFLGDDTAGRDDVTPAGRIALVDITREIERWAGKKLAYKGHRDAMSTECPGDELYGFVHSAEFARRVSDDLTKRTGWWSWTSWRLGEGDWKPYGPANPDVRPDVPQMIAPAWWERLREFLAARK